VRSAAQSVHLVAASAGFLSYLLMWATTIWGMLLGRGWSATRFKHSNVYATHMTLALTGMTLGWGHAFTQLANPTGTVFLVDEFVPFANGRDPIGIGVGVVATELMTALLISMPLQRKLGYRRWRALHSLAYASFTLIAGHVLLSGSDVGPLYVKIPVVALWLSTVVLWLGITDRTRKQRQALAEAEAAGGSGFGEDVPRGPRAQRPQRAEREFRAEVQVDPSRCARFGFCEQEAPEVFELRADGRLGYKTSVPPEHVSGVERAAKVCPARAIKLKRVAPVLDMPAEPEPAGRHGGGSIGNVTGLRRRGG
jgi:ferredoxin/DMSO/TMAO reductase YedYZ heme-binding membrane subunit